MILLYHLKELTLSFQKNIKSLKLDTPNKSYGCSKIPRTRYIDIQCMYYTVEVLVLEEILNSLDGQNSHTMYIPIIYIIGNDVSVYML